MQQIAQWKVIVGVLGVCVLGACSGLSNSASQPSAHEAHRVLGTWQYQANGTQVLSRGTFQIAMRKGQLRGILRDAKRGAIPLQVRVHNNRLSLDLEAYQVRGIVEGDAFTATLERPMWDVSVAPPTSRVPRAAPRDDRGALFARRVERAGLAVPPLGCKDVAMQRCATP
ncbi:hypothetical protein [Salisaeta longa]|uniref:hypothetical protein n=1 Tax=Salisaeta longa TaxID=503170 RepID=UPI00048F6020|nr:hypothetical protein [Salisaeta longa]